MAKEGKSRIAKWIKWTALPTLSSDFKPEISAVTAGHRYLSRVHKSSDTVPLDKQNVMVLVDGGVTVDDETACRIKGKYRHAEDLIKTTGRKGGPKGEKCVYHGSVRLEGSITLKSKELWYVATKRPGDKSSFLAVVMTEEYCKNHFPNPEHSLLQWDQMVDSNDEGIKLVYLHSFDALDKRAKEETTAVSRNRRTSRNREKKKERCNSQPPPKGSGYHFPPRPYYPRYSSEQNTAANKSWASVGVSSNGVPPAVRYPSDDPSFIQIARIWESLTSEQRIDLASTAKRVVEQNHQTQAEMPQSQWLQPPRSMPGYPPRYPSPAPPPEGYGYHLRQSTADHPQHHPPHPGYSVQ